MNRYPTTRRATMGALVAALSAGPSLLSRPAFAAQGEEVVIGDFETSQDGWTTNGANEAVTVPRLTRPGGVTRGERALEVYVDGDSYPMIERSVGAVDVAAHPYLVADVAPGMVSETGADVAFTFRLYHGSGDSDDKPAPQLSGPSVTIPETVPGQVYWDLSGINDATLADAQRLELAWHAAGQEPSSGPRGRNAGQPYLGRVTVDNVRLSDGVHPVSVARLHGRLRRLTFEHGATRETTVDSRSDAGQQGTVVFADETELNYVFEIVADGQYRFTLGDTSYELGGG